MMTSRLCIAVLILCFALSARAPLTAAQDQRSDTTPASPTAPPAARALQELVNETARATIARFADKGFKEENLALTVIDLRDPQQPAQASFRGNERIYPASVVKMFFLAAVHRWLEDGRLQDSEELRRAMRDMIVESSNDATHYVMDALTGTTSGVELPAAEMQEWANRRNAVNRYFASLGYTNINVNQKTYCEDAYGRERVFRAGGTNRNMLTTDATARLLAEIATGRMVTPERSRQMMELMRRDPFATGGTPDSQARDFIGMALQPGMRLWSKAGWTSTTRHDAAYIELPNGARFVIVVYTTNHSREREIIPTVARAIIAGFQREAQARQ